MADFNTWLNGLNLNSPAARHIDDDADGSFDCVDVAEDWAKYCYPGISLGNLLGYGDAKDLYSTANGQYFDKLPPNIASRPGDIPVWAATPTNAFGHIAVTINDDGGNLTDVEQNTYTQEAASIAHRTHNNLIGFLRPKGGDNMVTDSNHLNALFRRFRGREASQDEINRYVGKVEYDPLIESLDTGPEADATAKALAAGETALKDDWPGQIASLQSQLKAAGSPEVNALGSALLKLLNALGYKKG